MLRILTWAEDELGALQTFPAPAELAAEMMCDGALLGQDEWDQCSWVPCPGQPPQQLNMSIFRDDLSGFASGPGFEVFALSELMVTLEQQEQCVWF